jgi:glycosyltransferase involved in cell wall biosynthesis
MKKIVLLSAFVTPLRSGAEACAEEVSARLKDEFDITIVAARMRRDLPYLDHLQSGVKVWRVGIGHSVDKWLYPFLAPRIVRALKPDIVHAVLETFAGLALKRCRVKAKKILTLQTTNTNFLKGTIIRSADTVTAISTVLQSRAKHFGKEATLIPNGIRLDLIDSALSHRPKIDGRILYVGRLEPMKGVDTLLHAFATLDPLSHLRIVGDGSERSRLEKLAADLKITDRITFAGRVAPEKVADEFAQASVFCGLSRSEALGNVFLEAQAAGCAVVATNVGGIPDIVRDGETGLLVKPDDVEAAAGAIRSLLEDDQLREKLTMNGQKHAQGYDWGVIAEKYRSLYHASL